MRTRSTISTARRTLLRRGRDLLKGAMRGVSPKAGADVMDMLSEEERSQLGAIHKALERIERGIFGTCESCGERISEERIETAPWEERCTTCDSQGEAEPAPSFDESAQQPGLGL